MIRVTTTGVQCNVDTSKSLKIEIEKSSEKTVISIFQNKVKKTNRNTNPQNNAQPYDDENGSVSTEEYNNSEKSSSQQLIEDIIRNGRKVNKEQLERIVELKLKDYPLYKKVMKGIEFSKSERSNVGSRISKKINQMPK